MHAHEADCKQPAHFFSKTDDDLPPEIFCEADGALESARRGEARARVYEAQDAHRRAVEAAGEPTPASVPTRGGGGAEGDSRPLANVLIMHAPPEVPIGKVFSADDTPRGPRLAHRSTLRSPGLIRTATAHWTRTAADFARLLDSAQVNDVRCAGLPPGAMDGETYDVATVRNPRPGHIVRTNEGLVSPPPTRGFTPALLDVDPPSEEDLRRAGEHIGSHLRAAIREAQDAGTWFTERLQSALKIEGIGAVVSPSSSSYIQGPCGLERGLRGEHIYLDCGDYSEHKEIAEHLKARCINAGLWWGRKNARGVWELRTLVDFAPLKNKVSLDYIGPPGLPTGFSRTPKHRSRVVAGAQRLSVEGVRCADDELLEARHTEAEVRARASGIATQVLPKQGSARGIDLRNLSTVEAELRKNDRALNTLAPHDILERPDGTQFTVAEVWLDLEGLHGEDLVDPGNPVAGRQQARLYSSPRDNPNGPIIHSFAGGGTVYTLERPVLDAPHTTNAKSMGEPPPPPPAEVLLGGGGGAMRALHKCMADVGVIRFQGRLKQIVLRSDTARAEEMEAFGLRGDLSLKYIFTEFDKDGDTRWIGRRGMAPVDLVRSAMGMRDLGPIPDVNLILNGPYVSASGEVVHKKGINARTGVYLPRDYTLPPPLGGKAQIFSALDDLLSIFCGMPFDSAEDASAFLAALFTSVTRAALPTAPVIAVRAKKKGTGKTMFSQCFSLLAGDNKQAILTETNSEEEIQKTLLGKLQEGAPVVMYDNLRRWGGSVVDAYATSADITGRILGTNTTVDVQNRALWIINGNQLDIRGDSKRRVLPIDLGARLADPYARDFDGVLSPLHILRGRRDYYRGRLCRIVEAIRAQVRFTQKNDIKPFISGPLRLFKEWGDTVLPLVAWLAREGYMIRTDFESFACVGAGETARALCENDPEEELRGEFLAALQELTKGAAFNGRTLWTRIPGERTKPSFSEYGAASGGDDGLRGGDGPADRVFDCATTLLGKEPRTKADYDRVIRGLRGAEYDGLRLSERRIKAARLYAIEGTYTPR